MLNESVFDPTAGERARLNALYPEWSPPIVDPTDPRNGSTPAARRRLNPNPEAPREIPEPTTDRR
jgi:hypothetical protein